MGYRFHHKGFTAEIDFDEDQFLIRGRIIETGTLFYAKYNHQLESRFKAIVDNGWFVDVMPSRAIH